MSLSPKGLYRFDEFIVDPLKRSLVRGDVVVPLSPKAFEVLSYLVENPGRVLTKDELLKAVWPESFVEEGNLVQHIAALRRAFGDRASYIVTVPGRGYQFAVQVHRDPTVPPVAAGGLVTQTVRERTRIIVQESTAESGYAPASSLALAGKVRRRPWTIITAVSVILLAGAAWFVWHRQHWQPTGDHLDVVIADFDNRTGQEVFDVVLKNALEIDLEQSPLLSIVSLERTRSTMQQMGHSAQEQLTSDLAREVCERNSAQAMLSGSINKLGESYVITLDAMDCVSGKKLARLESQAKNQDEILQTVDGLASKMRSRLGESLHSIQGFDVPIQQSTTPSFEALVAYSRGIVASDADAVPYFERAIQLDPNFAMAYERLGAANGNLGNIATTRALFKKAYDMRKSTSVNEQFMITSRYYEIVEDDLDLAAKNYVLWTRSYPLDTLVWATLANTYTQMGRYPEAIEAGLRARTIDPNARFMFIVLARAYKRASQFDQAEAVCKDAIARGKDSWAIHSILFQIAVARHDQAGIDRESSWDKGKPTENQTLENAAFAEATFGRLDHARELFCQAQALTSHAESKDFAYQLDADEAEVDRLLGAPEDARSLAAEVPVDRDDISFVAGLTAALTGDTTYIGKLYVLGCNGQLLMHFAPLLGMPWAEYIEAMRDGVRKYGPVRAGIYAMTSGIHEKVAGV